MAEPIETLYIELQGRLDGLERTLKEAEQRLAQGGKQGAEAFSKGFASLDAKASAEVLQTATNLIKGYNDALKSADPRKIIEATTAVDQFKKSFADAPTVLRAVEQSLKQQDAALQKTSGTFRDFSGGLDQTITKIGSIAGIVAGGAIGLGAFDGLVRSVFSLAQEADRANVQAQLLASTLERNNISATAAEASFRATADALGVLPQQLTESSKLLLNYGATLDQVAKLQEIGGASALAAGRSAADGADLIAQAITTENSALLNGIGIARNLSTAYQSYAKEVGKTVEQLTAQEKAQAAVNDLLKETQSEVEALPTVLGGLAGQQQQLTNRFQEFRLALGEALIPAVTGTIRVLNQLLDNLPTVISVATTLAAIIGAQRLAGSFAVLNLSVAQGVSALAGWAATTVTTTTVTTALNGALNALRTFFLTSPAVIIAAGAALITFAQQASSAIRSAEEAALASDRAFNKAESSRIAALRSSSNEVDQLKGRIAALQAALSSIRLGELGGDAEATAAKIKQLRGELATLQAEQAKQNTAQATSNDLFREARTLVENLQKAQDSLSARQIFAAQQAIEAFTKANKEGSAIIAAVRSAIAEQNAQLKDNEKSAKAATKAISEWDNYLKSERLEAYRRGLEGMTEAQLRQEVTNQRSARAIDQLQAATARLNEIQTRRIELERQLAAQAASAPLEQSLAKLDRQYTLGTISAQQYLAAVNALLQSFSNQFAAATKGSEEYDRLRGIVVRLRDIQESLNDTLEETSLAFQRQQAALPLQNTIQALADSYKAAEISTIDYKTAIDGLLRSESAAFSSLEKGTAAYNDQREIILQLRDIQDDLIGKLNQESRVRSQLQRTISDQANTLRILSESGQVDFLQGIASQYVELQALLARNEVGDRAEQLANDLNSALNSVQLDDATRKAVLDLTAAFKELRSQIQIDDIQIPTQFNNFGTIIEDVGVLIEANTRLLQTNLISQEEALSIFEQQAQVVRDVVDSLAAQLAVQQAANASTEELADTTERLAKAQSLLSNLTETINTSLVPFRALAGLSFTNFTELSATLERILNPIAASASSADLLQNALREAAEAETLLGRAAATVDNQFTRQAETIRQYAAELEKTGQVAPDLIAQLNELARSLDIEAPLEEGRQKTEQLKNELLEAVDAFAGFGNLDIAGFDGLVSLGQGIARLIGGDILGGIQAILAPYADLLEPILRPLGGAFSDLLDSLNPMISALGELLNTVITPLVQIAASVLLPVFQALGTAIKIIADGVKFLFDGIVNIYNATVGQLFGQIGDVSNTDGLISRIEAAVGKIGDAAKEAILEMTRNVQETLASSFASALSDGILDAISTGDLDTAKKALEERLRQIVVQVIIDTAVKAALATAAVSQVLKNLSDAIAYAIATGDWSGVGSAITDAVSTVTGIMQQLSNVLTPVLGGLIPPTTTRPGTPGAPTSPINPFGVQQLPLSPQITVPLLDSANLISTGGTQISDASTALVEGLQSLELDTVASDMARSSRDFRIAVDDLGALLTNRTNWAGVNAR